MGWKEKSKAIYISYHNKRKGCSVGLHMASNIWYKIDNIMYLNIGDSGTRVIREKERRRSSHNHPPSNSGAEVRTGEMP